jgi:NAD(P)H dehydrogenase (quinone)
MIGITGSTGQLGGRVARLLAADGMPLRLVVRDPARAPQLDGAEVVAATYDDTEASRRALEGVDRLFMVSAAEHADRVDHHRAFIDAATDAGVQHVVYTSFINAAPDATFTLARDHWATEQHLQGSGLRWTMLRDNLYADFFPMLAGADGVIRGPAGDGRVAAVVQDDIADVAATVLRDPGAHAGRSYDLTGPEALTLHEVAAALTEATGRPYQYDPETLEEAYATRASYGVPDWQVDAWVSTYTAIAAGDLAEVSGDVAAITGHPPTSLDVLLHRSSRP